MDIDHSQEAPPPEQVASEPVPHASFADDAPTQPGAYARSTMAPTDANADTQPTRSGNHALQREWPLAHPARRRSNALGMGFCLGIATAGLVGVVLVVALAVGALYATHGLNANSLGGINGLGELASTPSSTAATPVATAKPAATHSAGVPTAPTPQTKSAPPRAKPTATPRPKNPPPPQLSVNPRQTSANCLLGHYPTLAVKNTGGGQLSWSAHTSDTLVRAAPSSGALSAGQSRSVSLSGIHVGKTLTVTFSSNGGGATVTINCA